MKNNNVSIVSSFFLVALLCVSVLRVEGACVFGHHTRVFVYNNITDPTYQLTAHCASGNDDLGLRVIRPNDNMNWGFCAYSKTLYFCHLWWGGKHKPVEVFKGGFLKDVASKYNWVAKEDGIYFYAYDSPQKLVKKYDWELGSVE